MLVQRTRDGLRRRPAVSGILAAMILFAMLFTIGASYFALINSSDALQNQDAATRAASAHGQGEEQLTLAPTLSGTTLTLTLTNSGGVSSTITAAFVTSQAGILYIGTHGQGYLTQTPDLSYNLPLALPVGASTPQMSFCSSTGCNIVFKTYTYTPGTTVLVSVLTQDGNVFSAQYPPSLTTETEVTDTTSYITTTSSLTDTTTSSVTTYLTSDTTTISCYECTTTAVAGGNILVMTIVATPSPADTGDTITANVTIWDYSAYQVTGVTVTLPTPEESGTASVAYTGGCTGSLTISSESFTTCSATYTANSGSSGGTVVFNGYAVGCVQTNIYSNCTTGTTVQSATASSNPVQIGNLISLGPWAPNFNYFKYTANAQQSVANAAIIPSTSTYVAVYVEVENTYNAPLTILDYSYAQFISPGSDVDAYIATSASYSGSTGTLSAYGCADSPPTAPTGTCIIVQPGETTEVPTLSPLVFAASAFDSTSWEWGGSDQGGSNIGTTVQITLAYALETSTSPVTWAIYAQNLPFQSVFVN